MYVLNLVNISCVEGFRISHRCKSARKGAKTQSSFNFFAALRETLQEVLPRIARIATNDFVIIRVIRGERNKGIFLLYRNYTNWHEIIRENSCISWQLTE